MENFDEMNVVECQMFGSGHGADDWHVDGLPLAIAAPNVYASSSEFKPEYGCKVFLGASTAQITADCAWVTGFEFCVDVTMGEPEEKPKLSVLLAMLLSHGLFDVVTANRNTRMTSFRPMETRKSLSTGAFPALDRVAVVSPKTAGWPQTPP